MRPVASSETVRIAQADDLRPGDFVQGTLTTLVDDYSYGAIVTGRIERIAAPVRNARRLPMMMIETVGSFGR